MNDMLKTIEAEDFEKPAWLFGTVILENREVAEKACRGLAIYSAIEDEEPFLKGTTHRTKRQFPLKKVLQFQHGLTSVSKLLPT